MDGLDVRCELERWADRAFEAVRVLIDGVDRLRGHRRAPSCRQVQDVPIIASLSRDAGWLTSQGAAAVIDVMKTHEARDEFWDRATLSTDEMAGIDHPVFIVGGMFDIVALSEVRAFTELQTHVAAASRVDIFLVMGPWTHGDTGARRQGELLYPETAPHLDNVTDFVGYFDWCLRDAARPSLPALRYFITELTDNVVIDPTDNMPVIEAGGEWRTDESWPPASASNVAMFIQQDDALSGEAPSDSATPVALVIDPSDMAPSLGGGNLTTAAGPFDQAEIDARPDVYVAQTAAVTEPVEIIGNVRARVGRARDARYQGNAKVGVALRRTTWRARCGPRYTRGHGRGLAVMIHHLSIPAEDPAVVARALAAMLGGHVTKFGPYQSSFIAWAGDEHGTAIEVYPSGTEMFPDAGLGQANFRHNPNASGFVATRRFAEPHQGRDSCGCKATRLAGYRALAWLVRRHRILDRKSRVARAHDA